MDSVCSYVTFGILGAFQRYINARTQLGVVGSCWSFGEVGCGLLVVMLKKETKGKKFDSGISLIPLSPLSLFLSVMG